MIGEQLQRKFRSIILDWDGTAVASRQEDPEKLIFLIESLLCLGVLVVVVAGTSFGHIDRQFCSRLSPGSRQRLLVCTNRGSEVWGFDRHGSPARRHLRTATPDEEQRLTAVAEALRNSIVSSTGLDVRIVYDRLNRRKVDLMPLPEWADPPKDRIADLMAAVEQRLCGAGMAGGLASLGPLAGHLAGKCALPGARITSDAKHIEIGLTDKGHSAEWIRRHLLVRRCISLEDVLVAGDEFGPMAGIPGSDSRMCPALPGAAVVSVGVEPNGVPEGVLHLRGGPARFRELLAAQMLLHLQAKTQGHGAAARRAEMNAWALRVMTPAREAAWMLREDGYEPALERELESRLALGNGFLGVRASLDQPTVASRPRTYVAGIFDIPASGDSVVPALAWAPDWRRLSIALDGELLSLESGETLAHSRALDLQRGLLLSDWRQQTPSGKLAHLRSLRFVSLASRPIAVQVTRIDVDRPALVGLENRWEPASTPLLPEELDSTSVWCTSSKQQQLAMSAGRDTATRIGKLACREDNEGGHRYVWVAGPAQPAMSARMVAVGRNGWPADEAREGALAALRRARRRGIPRLLASHVRAWSARWAESDVVIEGDSAAQEALRFAIYHLNAAANPEDDRVSIGARGLTGDAYMGHVFWDTEVFLLPFYIHTWPEAARALLMYRFHTLPAARDRAVRQGYRGALFAWESAGTGEDVTPTFGLGPDRQVVPIRSAQEEHHISADVAYAVWNYWLNTGDTQFLLNAGAGMMLETARFWASRATLESDGRYHIRHVMGPDEYHAGVDDNAYTNELARWNLERGVETARLLESRWPGHWVSLSAGLGLDAEELRQWSQVARGLATPVDPATGLLEQFAGFFQLHPVDLRAYERGVAAIDVLLGRETTQRSQVIKQADVVQLLSLLWERFPPAAREANFRFYEPRCGHGSSLSPPVHALVAARLGDVELAEQYLRETMEIDLGETMGRVAGGVHMGALGGLWQAAVLGFGGVAAGADGIALDPHLPPHWEAMRFPFRWRGRRLRIEVRQEPAIAIVCLQGGRPLTVSVGDRRQRLQQGESHTFQSRACRVSRRVGRKEVAS